MKTGVLARSLVLVAGLILSLHSVVPHVHGAAATDANADGAAKVVEPVSEGLLSLLKELVGSDLGTDHLEHFSPSHDVDLPGDLIAVFPPPVLPECVRISPFLSKTVRRKRVFRSRHFPPSAVYPEADAPRGPPTFA